VRDALKSADSAWYALNISKQLDLVDFVKKPIIDPIIKIIGNYITIKRYSGQVVPLEDALKIVDLSYDYVVYPCMCKKLFRGH